MNQKYIKILVLLFFCANIIGTSTAQDMSAEDFYQPKKSYADELNSYMKYINTAPTLSSPYSNVKPVGLNSDFSGEIPLNKQQLTPKEKEEMRLAKEKLQELKIPYSNEEFIKQIKKNKIDTVDLMLKAGMSPNADYFGEYAIFYAAKFNKTQIAKMLLEKGANPNAGFDSSLFWAIKNNNEELAKALIEAGAKVDYIELVSSRTILYTALKKKNYATAKLLIDKGVKIDNPSGFLIDKKNLYSKLGIKP